MDLLCFWPGSLFHTCGYDHSYPTQIRQTKRRLSTTFPGRCRSVGFVCFFSSSFSHKISVGRSGRLFKYFLLFKKTFSVGRNLRSGNFLNTFYFLKNMFRMSEISVGRSGKLFKHFYFLKTCFSRATKHSRSVEDKQAIFYFCLMPWELTSNKTAN